MRKMYIHRYIHNDVSILKTSSSNQITFVWPQTQDLQPPKGEKVLASRRT